MPPTLFFYLHPPYAHNIHKRLFHQICTHSPFCYQDELLMCLSAAPQMCKVRRHSAHLPKNALPQTPALISDAFSQSSELTKKCNFKMESGLDTCQTITGCVCQHRPVVRSMITPGLYKNHCHSVFVAFKEVFFFFFYFTRPMIMIKNKSGHVYVDVN